MECINVQIPCVDQFSFSSGMGGEGGNQDKEEAIGVGYSLNFKTSI